MSKQPTRPQQQPTRPQPQQQPSPSIRESPRPSQPSKGGGRPPTKK